MNELNDETREEYIRRLAHNRWEMRQHFKWKLNESADDDYRMAAEMVRQEEVRHANDTRTV